MPIKLTSEQQNAVEKIIDILGDNQQYATLGGLAGTGKTTIATKIPSALRNPRVVYLAPTGKASHNLTRRTNAPCYTIHSQLYGVDEELTRERGYPCFFYNPSESLRSCDLVVVDEASMVQQRVYEDLCKASRLLSFQIVWIGDHGQLPPVGASPRLMERCDAKLETIHRQAEDNPIILHAHRIRDGLRSARKPGTHTNSDGLGVQILYEHQSSDIEPAHFDAILCATNATRHSLNEHCRRTAHSRYSPKPLPDDKILILQNNREFNVFNGQEGRIVDLRKDSYDIYDAQILLDGESEPRHLPLWAGHFGKTKPNLTDDSKKFVMADFGYAMTVHKSQGSQWPDVLLVEENVDIPGWEWDRWAYTGVTRASDNLVHIVP